MTLRHERRGPLEKRRDGGRIGNEGVELSGSSHGADLDASMDSYLDSYERGFVGRTTILYLIKLVT
jgi:hypothetical protein